MKIQYTILFAAVLGMTLSVFAGVTNVTSYSWHDTITAAVAAANSGDKLLVSTGMYNETVYISGLEITMDGKYVADFTGKAELGATTVDGGGAGCVDNSQNDSIIVY